MNYIWATEKKKVFLGGTCNGSLWRERLIPRLRIDYYNPVVPNWTEECYQREIKEREECDYCLYVITPKMTGTYSIAEVIDDSNKRPEKTIFAFMQEDDGLTFDTGQILSLDRVGRMVESNGGKYYKCLTHVADFLNSQLKTVIPIPDDCRDCSRFITTKGTCESTEKSSYLCRAFERILTVNPNRLGLINNVERCEECKKAEVGDVP